MARARQSDRKIKRKPNSSHKFTPLSAKDFSSSVSSVSSEPTPILDMLVHSYRKQGLHRHFHARSSRQREISTRSGPRDSLFTPRRPVGAVPELFVTFRHVSLALDVPTPSALAAAASNQTNRETLASNQLSAIKNSVQSAFAVLTLSKTVTHRQILKNVTGAFIPGSMTIILGRSGSGKSMLLKLLSGRLNVSKDNVTLDGEVSYSGLSRKDLKTQLPQCIAYVPQQDLHLSGMTVKETLDFAFECCAINADASVVNTVCKARASEYLSTRPMMNLTGERDPVTVIRELGLTRCQETIVGDERIRGVSGGEKKRLTAGEMAFGLHAVSMMDEITTGLDSSSAYDIVNAQRRLARQQRQTVVISLQQPTPEIWALFDNVLLLAEGEVLYHGPRDHVQAYFEALGFVCPPKRDLADFLCDLASPQQIQYEQLHAPLPGRRRHPRNANEFADLWMMSPVYEAMVEELDCVDNDTEAYSQRHCKYEDKRLYLDQQTLLQVPAFRQSFLHSTWTVIKRQMRLFGRNKVFIVSRLVQDLLVGIMVGSVYYGMDLADVQVVSGVVFSCTLFLGLGQSATLSTFFDARQVFYKHRGANFYRSSSYVFATCLSQVPLAITEALIFGSLVYWLGGLVNSLEQFVVFVLYMFLTVLVFVSEYFFLSCACATLPVAQVISTFALLFYILFAGFAVSREQLPLALRWIYWCNPLAWTTRGILVSQYRSNILDVCEYGGIDYCRMFNGKTLGIYSLGLYDVPDNPKWIILGILFLTISLVVINLLSYAMLEYYRHESTLVLPLTSLSETILARQSYAMLSTPRGDADEFHEIDMTEIQARNELLVRDVNKDISDSFFASQGVPTDPKDVCMRLATQWNVPPVTLAFNDLRYTIAVPAVDCEGQHGIEGASDRPVGFGSCSKAGESKKTESRELLKGVTGYALPGTMTALMGSTGAGKTTLMDVLAGRKSTRRGNSMTNEQNVPILRGQVLLNGFEATELAIRRCTGYCEQTDVHSEASTFREALQFSAYLRQDKRLAPDRVEAIVDECLNLLDLEAIAHQLIRGSSSEQLKRLTLGVELVAQPSLLFLDEPTSGLDAPAAKKLMDGVRKVADSGCTVICTIHQPSADVFLLFDMLLLLQRGGETVYFGEVGLNGEILVNYFQGLGLPRSAPTFKRGDNPASWILNVIGAGVETIKPQSTVPMKSKPAGSTATTIPHHQQLDASTTSSASLEHVRQEPLDFVTAYKAGRLKQRLDAKRAAPGVFMPSDRLRPVAFNQRQAASNGQQLSMLVRRFVRLYWRTPDYSTNRIVMALTLGLIFGLVYSGSNDFTTYQGANGAVGLIFFSTCFLGVGAFVNILPLAFNERGPFYRERASETYKALWYFVASSVVEIPYAAITSMVFLSVFYPLAGFSVYSDFAQVVEYWLILTLHILFQTYFGQFFIFAMPSIELAAVFGALFDSIFLMFMGYNPPASSIPDGYKWLYQLVPHRYTFQSLTALVLGDCPLDQLQLIAEAVATNTTINVSGWPLGCQPLTDAPPTLANITLKSYIEHVFGASRDDTAGSIGVVVGLLLIMRLATLVVMRLVNLQKR